ncbi:hypothetical protein Tco_0700581 [Tanacetum coccineum]
MQQSCISLHWRYYMGRKVYSFDCYDTIRACNVNGKDPAVMVDVAKITEDVYDKHVFSGYIVGLDDGERKQLLVIIKEGCIMMGNVLRLIRESFKVLAYDLENDEYGEYEYSEKGGGRDMGIYHFSDGTIESHFTGESRSHFTPPIWLQSM